MLVAGVTGGIGSGKTTFTRFLEARGAVVIDADELGRRALEPGSPAWHSVVDQFGDEILAAAGMEIDRKRLAAIVFGNKDKLAALNAIVHPVIVKGVADTLDTLRGTDEVVILDAALIVELSLHSALDVLIVVVGDEDLRRQRLVADRKMTESEISERMAAQLPMEDLIARADIVVTNNGSVADLEAEADRVWSELQERRAG